MEFLLLNPIFLTALLSLILLWSFQQKLRKPPSTKNLPPSPPKLPIIGNLHQVGGSPHHNLLALSRKYGPLMLLHFGSSPVLVVSSPDGAREVMKEQDVNFASRAPYKLFKKLLYGCMDTTMSAYGEHWRRMKSTLVLQLLSNKRVQNGRYVRDEETALFVKRIYESAGKPVNITDMFTELSNDAISRSALGRKYSMTENGKKFLVNVSLFMGLLGTVRIGEFIPWLSWIDRVNGFDKKADKIAKDMDVFMESVIEERIEILKRQEKKGDNFLDLMLEIYNGSNKDLSLDRNDLKPLLLDIFVGGTDTMATSLDWTMVELLRHPTVMEKVQREVRGIVGDKVEITEDDLEKMHYMKAVIKESFRYHPPAVIFPPRLAAKDTQVLGYDVAAGTIVMVSAYAITRDPCWDEPEKFIPERFLNSSIDFYGQDFELIPFGAGRRRCPGIAYSAVTMDLLLANLLQKFDWKLPDGVQGKDLDMTECPGMTVHRVDPLLVVATPRK